MTDLLVKAVRAVKGGYAWFHALFGGKVVYAAKTRLPETRLSVQVADAMRVHALEGRYRGVFSHVANEGKREPRNGWMLKAMGMVPGAPDWWFVFRRHDTGGLGAVLVELKTAKTTLTPAQVMFGEWCGMGDIPHVVCRSVEEVEAVLRQHGALGG